ncbi:hypothetical protein N0V88_004526 [Collariella sp. IMI 366227]|nr:hypothetical protein N0V88_004526 [Collariella sp. IMI 366227]
MRSLGQIVVPVGLAILVMGWVASGEDPGTLSIAEYCAYQGGNLTGDHWLIMTCRNELTAIFGFNQSWYLAFPEILGNYSDSCVNCNVDHSQKTLTLTCHCDKIPVGRMTSTVDLSESFDVASSAS